MNQPSWAEVSKSGGLWAAALDAAGHTCDRVPVAISPARCVNAKWCHTGCIFGAKNSLITNYLWAAENAGVRVLPNLQAQLVKQSSARPYRYIVQADVMDNEGPSPTRAPTGQQVEFECKVLVLSDGRWTGRDPLAVASRGAARGLAIEHRPLQRPAANDLAIPSRSEGIPNVALEAMACGTPVIATDVGGIPEVVPAGSLVQPEDPQALAHAIQNVITRAATPIQFSPLTWDQSAAELASALERTIQTSGATLRKAA